MLSPDFADGFPIVLTADRVLMADYPTLLDGMVAATQTTRLPGLVMRGLVARPMPSVGLRAARAPLGLRRVEAALLAGGFAPDDVAVVPPGNLRAAVGPATRVVGLSSGDPLGLGMMTSTMDDLTAGRSYTPVWFRALTRTVARLRRRHPFRVMFGGPGAWQLALDPAARAEHGIDCVFCGYADREAAGVVRRLAEGDDVPPIVRGVPVDAAAIPAIRGPAGMGAVELSRGCGRGCGFCTMGNVPMIHLPAEAVLADVETNVRGGAPNISLLSEDLFRYGAAGSRVNPEALIGLVGAVRSVAGVRLIQADHAGVAAVAQFDDRALGALHEAMVAGTRHRYVWLNVGVETASGELLRASGAAAKMRPYAADDWAALCEDSIRRLVEAGFTPMVSVILGLPGEMEDDVERTTALVQRMNGWPVVVFPVFRTPVGPDDPGFRVSDMTPAHWRLFRRSYDLNFRWIPRMHWDNLLGAGGSRVRAAAIQLGGRASVWQWKWRFFRRSRSGRS